MVTFFVCRLPTWIFLLIKLHNELTSSDSWIVHFSLGLLSLANCAINPFLYTFLTETIQFGSGVKERLKKICCCFCVSRGEGLTLMPSEEKKSAKKMNLHKESFFKRYCCCWDPCGKEELPDDKNLIDRCDSNEKYFRRKSYTLNGKNQLSCISSNVNPPVGHYANVYVNCNPLTIIPFSDPDHFVDVDLANKK